MNKPIDIVKMYHQHQMMLVDLYEQYEKLRKFVRKTHSDVVWWSLVNSSWSSSSWRLSSLASGDTLVTNIQRRPFLNSISLKLNDISIDHKRKNLLPIPTMIIGTNSDGIIFLCFCFMTRISEIFGDQYMTRIGLFIIERHRFVWLFECAPLDQLTINEWKTNKDFLNLTDKDWCNFCEVSNINQCDELNSVQWEMF